MFHPWNGSMWVGAVGQVILNAIDFWYQSSAATDVGSAIPLIAVPETEIIWFYTYISKIKEIENQGNRKSRKSKSRKSKSRKSKSRKSKSRKSKNQGNRNQGNRNQGNRNQGNRNQGNRKSRKSKIIMWIFLGFWSQFEYWYNSVFALFKKGLQFFLFQGKTATIEPNLF